MATTAKRLAPTAETVRRLYLLSGNQCAFPGCNHPIITTEGTYVGELCHICAAEEGGERFDPTQTNEDRRQFENLLLMCHDHHVVTDDVLTYSIDQMRQLKADHEKRFALGLASMMESASVQIIDSTVSLGGEGGKAPGSGGGGGGAIGPGAIGGSGGSGGEIKQAISRLDEDILLMRVSVGKGGQGGVDGNGGSDGDDTVLEVVHRDGSVQEILRARGGRGGDSGCGSARVSTAMLANSVELREGLIFALAAGWKSYIVDTLPAPAVFGVLYIAEPDSGAQATITTSVFDPQNKIVASHSQGFDFSQGSVPFAVKVCAFVTELGTWHAVLNCGERELWRMPFEVQLRALS